MMGMLMLGKISTGMRSAASVPRINIKNAATTNVYGRASAILTMASMQSNLVEPLVETISALFQLKCRAEVLTYPRHRAPGPFPHGGRPQHRHLRRGLPDPHLARGVAGGGGLWR